MNEALAGLLREVRACTRCAPHLPHGPRPVLQADDGARVLIVGQAPGRKVHDTGVPFNDVSGDRLREWLGVDRATFYDASRIALLPMGFCYPGTVNGGDLPPRVECALAWRAQLLAQLSSVRLTILLGRYAIGWHLTSANAVRGAREPAAAALPTGVISTSAPPPPRHRSVDVGQAVAGWRTHAPALFPLPHPSPRNRLWLRRHPWFESELLPALREQVRAVLDDSST